MSTKNFLGNEVERANDVLDLAEAREAELEATVAELLGALKKMVATDLLLRDHPFREAAYTEALAAIAKATS